MPALRCCHLSPVPFALMSDRQLCSAVCSTVLMLCHLLPIWCCRAKHVLTCSSSAALSVLLILQQAHAYVQNFAGARLQSWLAATKPSPRPKLLLLLLQLQLPLVAPVLHFLVYLLQQLPMMQPSSKRCPRQIRARKANPAKARKWTTTC